MVALVIVMVVKVLVISMAVVGVVGVGTVSGMGMLMEQGIAVDESGTAVALAVVRLRALMVAAVVTAGFVVGTAVVVVVAAVAADEGDSLVVGGNLTSFVREVVSCLHAILVA